VLLDYTVPTHYLGLPDPRNVPQTLNPFKGWPNIFSLDALHHRAVPYTFSKSTQFHKHPPSNISFIHSIGMYTMWRFLAVLRSFFHSSLLCTFSCHPSTPTIRPYSHTSSCHLFLGPPLNLVVPRFIYTRVGTLIVATIYLQLIQNRYMFRSFTVLQCSHQHCVQTVASDVEVIGYL